jgi:hypothetical protein
MLPVALIAVAAFGQDAWPALSPRQVQTATGAAFTLPAPEAKATVVLFTAVDCPIANRFAPEVSRIASDFGKQGFAFLRVYVDKTVPLADVIKHGDEFKLDFPATRDDSHALVKALGATVTPEAAVVGADGTLLYRGRINDLWLEHGRARDGEYRHDLRIALEEISAGKPVTLPFTAAIGCGIPD